jgi:hypothetical protein
MSYVEGEFTNGLENLEPAQAVDQGPTSALTRSMFRYLDEQAFTSTSRLKTFGGSEVVRTFSASADYAA